MSFYVYAYACRNILYSSRDFAVTSCIQAHICISISASQTSHPNQINLKFLEGQLHMRSIHKWDQERHKTYASLGQIMQQMDQTHGKSISLSLSGGTIMQFRVVNRPKQANNIQHKQAKKPASSGGTQTRFFLFYIPYYTYWQWHKLGKERHNCLIEISSNRAQVITQFS